LLLWLDLAQRSWHTKYDWGGRSDEPEFARGSKAAMIIAKIEAFPLRIPFNQVAEMRGDKDLPILLQKSKIVR
jgi:hypothetical protein